MMGSLWSLEREQQLKQLWNTEGLTASQCATVLGVSRNAVIGKVHRLRLDARVLAPKKARLRAPLSEEAKARARAFRREEANAKNNLVNRMVARLKAPPPEVFKPSPEDLSVGAWDALPGTAPVSMTALGRDTCRWPIGDERPFAFCGCPVAAGSSYCPTHKHRSTGRGTVGEQSAERSAAVISRLEVKNGFRSRQAGQSL